MSGGDCSTLDSVDLVCMCEPINITFSAFFIFFLFYLKYFHISGVRLSNIIMSLNYTKTTSDL